MNPTIHPLLLLPVLLLLQAAPSSRVSERIDPATARPHENGAVLFYDVRSVGIEGQGWTDVESPFDRLPAKAKAVVRPAVWRLARHSAGLCVRFATGSTSIHARWTLSSADLAMRHMPATGVSGVDLYVKHDGRWRWLAVGQPSAQTTSAQLVKDIPADAGPREYLLYFPLYNGVSSVEIGIPKSASLYKAAPRPAERNKPVVFYGTSITQGGCASRPGMCHTAILGRRLDRPVINLGFSGNGHMEPEVGRLLAALDPAVFVIDCLPNVAPDGVAERTAPLVKTIRAARPTTPIVLVEDRTYGDAFLLDSKLRRNRDARAALRKAFDELVAAGDKNLHYIPGDKILADDGDDMVDGSHPTDLGFVRYADAFEPVLAPLLEKRSARTTDPHTPRAQRYPAEPRIVAR